MPKFDLVIRANQFIDGERRVSPSGNIYIGCSNGVISYLGDESPGYDADDYLELKAGNYLLPGTIDPHAHAREPGNPEKQTYKGLGKAAIQGGITTAFIMPNTGPPITEGWVVADQQSRSRAAAIDIFHYVAVLESNMDGFVDLAGIPGVIGGKLYTCKTTGGIYVEDPAAINKVMKAWKRTGKVLSVHAENQAWNEAAEDTLRDHAITYDYAWIHSDCRSPASEIYETDIALQRALEHGVPVHIAHQSTAGGLAVKRYYLERGGDITSEVTPHHLYFCTDMISDSRSLKMNPPIRSRQDMLALRKVLCDGGIDMIGTDHAPHTPGEKESAFWGCPCGVTSYDDLGHIITWLESEHSFSFQRIAQVTSGNVAKRFGLDDRGFIREGQLADFAVYSAIPEQSKPENRFSSTSPYDSIWFPGRVEHVVKRGKVVKRDGNVLL